MGLKMSGPTMTGFLISEKRSKAFVHDQVIHGSTGRLIH
jgi:hypothetical protein